MDSIPNILGSSTQSSAVASGFGLGPSGWQCGPKQLPRRPHFSSPGLPRFFLLSLSPSSPPWSAHQPNSPTTPQQSSQLSSPISSYPCFNTRLLDRNKYKNILKSVLLAKISIHDVGLVNLKQQRTTFRDNNCEMHDILNVGRRNASKGMYSGANPASPGLCLSRTSP